MARMQKREILDKIYRFLKFIYIKLVRINDSPQKVALGFALGVFAGVMPVISLREAFFLALLFRVNWPSALLSCILTDNWTTILTFLLAIKTGSYIMGVDWHSIYATSQQLLKHFHWSYLLKLSILKILIPVTVGYIVISLFFAFLSYLFALIVVTRIKFKKRKDSMKKMLLSFIVVVGIAIFTSYVFAAPDEVAKQNVVSEANKTTDNNATINALDEHGFTQLIEAAKSNSLEVAKLLMDKGVDVNLKDANTGATALMYAVGHGNLDMVKLLLENKADINATDKAEQTALMIAAMNGSLEITKLLIEKGADINLQEGYKMNALMFALSQSNLDVAKLLIDKGTDVNAKDLTGETALMMTAEGDFPDITKILIDKGADINAKDKDGKTALAMANEFKHDEIASLLKQPKKDIGEAGGKQ
ncbi:MAG: DUF2062 domain-containing protein [Candidatus Omnitrophota bacterium]|jgi:ankyrin repeat protein/uncharacterized protein (DUF2062 family)